VFGNDHRDECQTFNLAVPLDSMGMAGLTSYRVIDLWTGRWIVMTESELRDYSIVVPADYAAGGGVRAVKIEPANSSERRDAKSSGNSR
jgi:hypothetical protein